MGIAATLTAAARALAGHPARLPDHMLERHPELARARWRRGGLPVRIGGWCLGQRSVSAITLWHTIWLAPHLEPSEELLLHEIRHVAQFEASVWFPARYLWESVRRGYSKNRYEVDARRYAAGRARPTTKQSPDSVR
jgi:hypothetical protein